MTSAIAASRLSTLVGGFDRSPAYAGLADELRLLIGDGRVGLDLRLPSERDLSLALGVSRTTVTRAYAALVDSGYAVARQGSGTFTRLPGGRRRVRDRTLTPHQGAEDLIDLGCAAPVATPGIAAAYAEAVQELPCFLGGHGYFPTGLPALQEQIAATYDERGLPTDPAQVLVVPGALSALMVVAQALVGPRDRVLVESPGYPNAHAALRRSGARLVPVPMDTDGWDLDTLGSIVRDARPALAYVIADFHNPTGALMTDPERERYADLLRRSGTVAVVDESHTALRLDGPRMPRPFAAYASNAVTVGSTSKSLWGGLRTGWIRCPEGALERLVEARLALDLGTPVLEQLAATRLLADRTGHWQAQRDRLRAQRDALAAALSERLPEWRFRLPHGGLSLWCELPPLPGRVGAVALTAEAEARGVVVSPGPVFAAEGGLDSFVRIPFTRPEEELRAAVDRLAESWDAVTTHAPASGVRRARVMVA